MPVDPPSGSAGAGATSRPRLTRRAQAETVVIWVVLALYLAVLLKVLLLSRPIGSGRSVNLVPFASIISYLTGGSAATAVGNVLGNVLLFVPFGAYLAYLRPRARTVTTVLVVVATSVAVEVIQGLLAIGASDVDDVILNSLGGGLGILGVALMASFLSTPARVRTTMAALSVLLLPVSCYLLFVIRLRL